jgi:hypothetical protein
MVLAAVSASAQPVNLVDGLGVAKFGRAVGLGPSQGEAPASASAGLQFFTQAFTSFDTTIPMNIVGTDPGLGGATTAVPTVIVPLRFVFTAGTMATLDGTVRATTTANSPMFRNANYTTGGTDLGTTQYGDAMQRGEFWNYPGFSPDYHVLLGDPTIAPTVTVTVPAAFGRSDTLVTGTVLGRMDLDFFDSVLNGLRGAYGVDTLPIFLTDNVYLYQGVLSNCCILGFHNSEAGPIATAHTWIFAAYSEPGTFVGDVFVDVVPLSHEVAEWLNDPFVGDFVGLNFIPPAILPGQGGACIINFETGDPLEAPPVVFTKMINGTTYHLQDEVFLPWYTHAPSFSVNGFFTLLGTFPTFSTLCGPG